MAGPQLSEQTCGRLTILYQFATDRNQDIRFKGREVYLQQLSEPRGPSGSFGNKRGVIALAASLLSRIKELYRDYVPDDKSREIVKFCRATYQEAWKETCAESSKDAPPLTQRNPRLLAAEVFRLVTARVVATSLEASGESSKTSTELAPIDFESKSANHPSAAGTRASTVTVHQPRGPSGYESGKHEGQNSPISAEPAPMVDMADLPPEKSQVIQGFANRRSSEATARTWGSTYMPNAPSEKEVAATQNSAKPETKSEIPRWKSDLDKNMSRVIALNPNREKLAGALTAPLYEAIRKAELPEDQIKKITNADHLDLLVLSAEARLKSHRAESGLTTDILHNFINEWVRGYRA